MWIFGDEQIMMKIVVHAKTKLSGKRKKKTDNITKSVQNTVWGVIEIQKCPVVMKADYQ